MPLLSTSVAPTPSPGIPLPTRVQRLHRMRRSARKWANHPILGVPRWFLIPTVTALVVCAGIVLTNR